MALETRIYQRENSHSIPVLIRESFRDIWNSRFLSRQLAERDIKAQYRQSMFGIIWAFITPLLTGAIWIFLNFSGTIQVSDTGIPYPVFAFSGTLLWSIIKESINVPSSSTRSSLGIMGKINFPREAVVVAGIYKMLFNSFLKIILLVVFVFLFGIGFHWSLLLLPFVIIAGIVFGIGIGLFLTPINMLYSDVSRIISMGLNFLMYITPVVYAIPESGLLRKFMLINPFTPLIVTMRDLIVGSIPQFLSYFLGVMVASIPLLILGLVFYRISIPIIVERSN